VNNAMLDFTVKGIRLSKPITRATIGALSSCSLGAITKAAMTPSYRGLWWAAPAASESGWGLSLNQHGDTILGTWFTYDLDGAPLWLALTATKMGQGRYSGISIGERARGSMHSSRQRSTRTKSVSRRWISRTPTPRHSHLQSMASGRQKCSGRKRSHVRLRVLRRSDADGLPPSGLSRGEWLNRQRVECCSELKLSRSFTTRAVRNLRLLIRTAQVFGACSLNPRPAMLPNPAEAAPICMKLPISACRNSGAVD
jgi:hypothetical protein